jgi:hypothetical protein
MMTKSSTKIKWNKINQENDIKQKSINQKNEDQI